MPNQKPIVQVEAARYSGGFTVHNWMLYVPETKTLPAQMFWLGQDAKVCVRLLGAEPRDVARHLHETCGVCDLGLVKCQEELARLIVGVAGGLRQVRQLPAWGLAVE